MNTIAGLVCGHNQASHLDAALKSLKGVDELFYIDPGSEDGSLEIAGRHGAVYLPAIDSGAGCRNAADEAMRSDWLLWISPDDRLEPGGIEKLRKIASTVPADINVVDIWIQQAKTPERHLGTRMTRKGVKYYGRVHEIPREGVYFASTVTIIHDAGPWHEKPSDPQSLIAALASDVAEHPSDPRWYYYLAREFFAQQDYGNALFWFNLRCEMAGSPGELADAYIHVSHIWTKLGNREKARRAAFHAFEINPNHQEAAARLAYLSDELKLKTAWAKIAAQASNEGVLVIRPV